MIHVQNLKIVIFYSRVLCWYVTFLINIQMLDKKRET